MAYKKINGVIIMKCKKGLSLTSARIRAIELYSIRSIDSNWMLELDKGDKKEF